MLLAFLPPEQAIFPTFGFFRVQRLLLTPLRIAIQCTESSTTRLQCQLEDGDNRVDSFHSVPLCVIMGFLERSLAQSIVLATQEVASKCESFVRILDSLSACHRLLRDVRSIARRPEVAQPPIAF